MPGASQRGFPVSAPTAEGRTLAVLPSSTGITGGLPGYGSTSRKDVLGRVDVPVVPGTAARTRPAPGGKTQLREQLPAHRAGLRRGEPAVDHHQGASGAFGLVLQLPPELTPPRIARASLRFLTMFLLFPPDHRSVGRKRRGPGAPRRRALVIDGGSGRRGPAGHREAGEQVGTSAAIRSRVASSSLAAAVTASSIHAATCGMCSSVRPRVVSAGGAEADAGRVPRLARVVRHGVEVELDAGAVERLGGRLAARRPCWSGR